MPTYDYVCNGCGHEFELFQQMSEPVKRKCPKCGLLKLERLIGAGAGVIFKGGGFYETDYRSDSYKKAADAEKKASEGKSDQKDAKKSNTDAKPKTESNGKQPKTKPAGESGTTPKSKSRPKSD